MILRLPAPLVQLISVSIFCLLPAQLPAAAPEDLIQLILRNDVSALKASLQAGADANARGEHDTSLLMYAAGFGSLESMQALLASGADVNAANSQKATALLWAASDIEKVRFLLSHGADVNAASALGRQAIHIAAAGDGGERTVPLLIQSGANPGARDTRNNTTLLFATFADNIPLMKLLIDKGVDVNAAGKNREWTPVMIAAGLNNLEALKLLISKGADVNAVTAEHQDGSVKNGFVNVGHMTALMWAAPHGSPAVMQALLDAKAGPNAKDVRGMTPLMLSVASEPQNPAVVKLLLGGGADPAIKSAENETAGDWAAKFGKASTMRQLGAGQPAKETSQAAAKMNPTSADIRKAAERGLALLQSTSVTFFQKGGCTGCHHSDLTMFATGVAAAHGVHADEKAADEILKEEKSGWQTRVDSLMQRIEGGGEIEQIAYPLLGLAAMKYPADIMTAAMVTDIAATQNADGSWHRVSFSRAPLQDTDIARAAIAARALRSYAPPARQSEFNDRVSRTAAWLSAATPVDNEDRAMQLLGLAWTGARPDVIKKVAKELRAAQQPGGGWRQNDNLPSDAYATGLALYALHEAGALSATDAAYRRGAGFLVSTQASDGSWHVKSRAVKLQPYFQSGFPYDHDQWISAAGTAWASAALTIGSVQPPMTAARR